MLVKENLHKMIEELDDEHLLQGFYSLLSTIRDKQTGQLYGSLSDEQKKELDLAYEESFDEENLLDHEDVKGEYV